MRKGHIFEYDGIYGFIESDNTKFFFHNSVIPDSYFIRKGDKVSFEIRLSEYKKGSYEAFNVKLIESKAKNVSLNSDMLVGALKWFDQKGYGILKTIDNSEYFLHVSNYYSARRHLLYVGNVFHFEKSETRKKISAVNCGYANSKEDLIHILTQYSIADMVEGIDDYDDFLAGSRNKVCVFAQTYRQYLYGKSSDEVLLTLSEIYSSIVKYKVSAEQLKFFEIVLKVTLSAEVENSRKILFDFFNVIRFDIQRHEDFYYELWLDEFIEDIDKHVIETRLKNITQISSEERDIIFSKISDPIDQEYLLEQLSLYLADNIHTRQYDLIRCISEIKCINDDVRIKFVEKAFSMSNNETKAELWFKGIVPEKDFEAISERIICELRHESPEPIQTILKKLPLNEQEESIFPTIISKLSIIDSGDKYKLIKHLIKLNEYNDEKKRSLINNIFQNSDDERRYLLWLDGYTELYDEEYLAGKLINENNWKDYSICDVFKRFKDEMLQKSLFELLLSKLGFVEDNKKLLRIKDILKCDEIYSENRSLFVEKVYINTNEEGKYILWYYKLTNKIDLDFLCSKLLLKTRLYDPSYYEHHNIIDRIENEEVFKILVNKMIGSVEEIYEEYVYNNIKKILNHTNMQQDALASIYRVLFEKGSDHIKFLLWREGFIEQKDIDYISMFIRQRDSKSFASRFQFTDIFRRLEDDEECDIVLSKLIDLLSPIDSEDKYIKVKGLLNQESITEPSKNLLLNNAYNASSVWYKAQIYLDNWQYKEEKERLYMYDYFVEFDGVQFFNFWCELFYPLFSKGGINKFYWYDTFLKMYLDQMKGSFTSRSQKYNCWSFSHRGVNLSALHYEKKIAEFNRFNVFLNENRFNIEKKCNEIVDLERPDQILSLALSLRRFQEAYDHIFKDLGLVEDKLEFGIEKYVMEKGNTPSLLKLWIYDLISHFDFTTYSCYYFTLSLSERKIFNRKARVIMGLEIKDSMLKVRVPWSFMERRTLDNGCNVVIYTATWRSIWFEDEYIRVCINDRPTFSQRYKWEFSEEKFNYLYEYISGRRLKELIITTYDGDIIDIDGLDELEEVIWKALIYKEVETSADGIIRGVGRNKIPVNMIVRNKCIQLLNKLQLSGLEPTRLLEMTISDKQCHSFRSKGCHSFPDEKFAFPGRK